MNGVQAPAMILQQLSPDPVEYGAREESVTISTVRGSSNIRPRPDELVDFRRDNPAWRFVIQAESNTGLRGHLHALPLFGWGVSNRADPDELFASVDDHHRTGAILTPFKMSLTGFVSSQVGVFDYVTRPNRDVASQSLHLVIELGGFRRRFSGLKALDRLVVETTGQDNLPDTRLQALIFVSRDQNGSRLSMTEDFNRLALDIAHDLTKSLTELRRIDLRHHKAHELVNKCILRKIYKLCKSSNCRHKGPIATQVFEK